MTTTSPLVDLPLSILGKGRSAHMKHLVVTQRRGAIIWSEEASRLHTQSPDQAQAWRDHGLDVTALTDPDEIAAVITREDIVWVTP